MDLVVTILATFAQKERTILELPRPAKTVLLDRRRLTKVALPRLVRLGQPRVSHALLVKRLFKLLPNAQRVVLVNPVWVVLVVTMSVLNARPELLPLPFRQLV